MDADKKALWVDALRSGDYIQTAGRLVREEDGRREFCCLGVACDLAKQAGIVQETEREDHLAYAPVDDVENWESGVLPRVVSDWLGLSEPNPTVDLSSFDRFHWYSEASLAEANDSGEFTFNDIADIIEAQL